MKVRTFTLRIPASPSGCAARASLQAARFRMASAAETADARGELAAMLLEVPSRSGPFGVRGVGEPPVIPGAAAIGNAIRDATGVRLTAIPMTAERLYRALTDGRTPS